MKTIWINVIDWKKRGRYLEHAGKQGMVINFIKLDSNTSQLGLVIQWTLFREVKHILRGGAFSRHAKIDEDHLHFKKLDWRLETSV